VLFYWKIRIFKVVEELQDDLEKILKNLEGVLVPGHNFSAPRDFDVSTFIVSLHPSEQYYKDLKVMAWTVSEVDGT